MSYIVSYIEFEAQEGDLEELRRTRPNCYSYVVREYSKSLEPGELSGAPIEWGSSANEVASAVDSDMWANNRTSRPLESYDSPILPFEYRIAVRVGVAIIEYPSGQSYRFWDYHFMVQTKTGDGSMSWARMFLVSVDLWNKSNIYYPKDTEPSPVLLCY